MNWTLSLAIRLDIKVIDNLKEETPYANLSQRRGGAREITLKMRSLLSDTRASPPLKWTVHTSTRIVIATPITLIIGIIGNRTTGIPILICSSTKQRDKSSICWSAFPLEYEKVKKQDEDFNDHETYQYQTFVLVLELAVSAFCKDMLYSLDSEVRKVLNLFIIYFLKVK